MEIIQAETQEQIERAREIFREYEAWLGLSLCFQGFEQELAELPGKYAAPLGRLWLAIDEGQVVGCIALRKLEDGISEMKRLYVRSSARGKGVGKLLVQSLIEEARKIGYEKMRLDTYPPKMGQAVKIYHSMGFVEIEPYYGNPNEGTLYMELKLKDAGGRR
jgi:ribosomal protein S18 acetylase RimI-like enzyme